MAGRPTAPTSIIRFDEILSLEAILAVNWTLLLLVPEITDNFKCIQWCARRRLLQNTISCNKCNSACNFKKDLHKGDQYF
jgi:hypothetical protein